MKPYYEEAGIVIYHGDCREVLPTLDRVDHVITDPPYSRDVYLRMKGNNNFDNFNVNGKGAALMKMAAGEIGCVDDLIVPVSKEIGRVLERWGLVFSDVENCHRWRLELEASGLRYARTGAWIKLGAMPQISGDRPGVGFEPLTIAHATCPMKWNGGGALAVWSFPAVRGTEKSAHPCPKPLPLMSKLMVQFTDPGELILDPFMGSGTTLLAAKNLGRRAIGIELEEKYCEIAAKRLGQSVMNFGAKA